MLKKEKVVVLVSGGQDSTVAYHLALKMFGYENVIALYVDIDQPYREQELDALHDLGIQHRIVKADLCDPLLNNAPTPEKQAIYGRNLLMTFYGALLGNRVWLSALENELVASVPDMEWSFFTQATAFYTTAFKELRPHTIVESPFENMTKTEMIQFALGHTDTFNALSLTKEYLLKTVSCYDPQGSCGKCAACFKRWISWVNNGIEENFKVKPYDPKTTVRHPHVEKTIIGMQNGEAHYWSTPKRVAETHNALVRVGGKGVVQSWAYHQIPANLLTGWLPEYQWTDQVR